MKRESGHAWVRVWASPNLLALREDSQDDYQPTIKYEITKTTGHLFLPITGLVLSVLIHLWSLSGHKD